MQNTARSTVPCICLKCDKVPFPVIIEMDFDILVATYTVLTLYANNTDKLTTNDDPAVASNILWCHVNKINEWLKSE